MTDGKRCHPRTTGSFAACLRAALEPWGRLLPCEWVTGLSGSPFSQPVRKGEACAAKWADFADDARIEFLGHALGFKAAQPARGEPAELVGWAEQVVRSGGVVLCGSPARWVLITDAREAALLPPLSAEADAEAQCRPRPRLRLHALQPAERGLTRQEAAREAIRFGAAAAGGVSQSPEFVCGAGLYDTWLSQLETGRFCPSGTPDAWRCAATSSSRLHAGQLAASVFLRTARQLVPNLKGNGCLERAAGTYAAMAQKLAPYATADAMAAVLADPAERHSCRRAVAGVRDLHHQAARQLAAVACTV